MSSAISQIKQHNKQQATCTKIVHERGVKQ